MKKFFCFLILFLFVNITGCRVQHFLITGIKFSGIESYKDGNRTRYKCITEFTDHIMFAVSYEREFQYTAGNIRNGIGFECYATSLGTAYDNSLLKDTFSIIFDKPFEYSGQIYNAGTNLMDIPEFEDQIQIIEDYIGYALCTGGDIRIEFSDTFSQNASFEEGDYTVTFSCETSDEKFLQAETTVKFSLNK